MHETTRAATEQAKPASRIVVGPTIVDADIASGETKVPPARAEKWKGRTKSEKASIVAQSVEVEQADSSPPRPEPRPTLAIANREQRPVADRSLKAESVTTDAEDVRARSTMSLLADSDSPLEIQGDLKAVVLVEANRAPAELVRLAETMPDARLERRIGSIDLHASGQLLALISFVQDGEVVDAAVIESLPVNPPVATRVPLAESALTGDLLTPQALVAPSPPDSNDGVCREIAALRVGRTPH